MPIDDLLEHAKAEADYYAVIGEGVHAGSTQKDISRAYRRSAIKHHPDKNKDDPNAVARFHQLQIAYDVLSDDAARAIFDAAQTAREAKKQRTAALDGRRKELIDKLERGERMAFKRKKDETQEEEELEREVKRLAADGARRIAEFHEKKVRAAQEEAAKAAAAATAAAQEEEEKDSKPNDLSIRKTVKIRWNADAHDIDSAQIEALFQKFGTVEAVVLKKPKAKKKKTIGGALILYRLLSEASRAVHEMKDQTADEWRAFDDIGWVDGKGN